MYLKMPKKCALADQLQGTRPNTASMLAMWQTLFVFLTGSLTTDARSNLFPGAPAGCHGCKEPVAFCFESVFPSEDKTRHDLRTKRQWRNANTQYPNTKNALPKPKTPTPKPHTQKSVAFHTHWRFGRGIMTGYRQDMYATRSLLHYKL